MEWITTVTNDPYNDYELVIEIEHDNEIIIILKKGKKRKVGLKFMWYAHNNNLIMTLNSLFDLMTEIKKIHPKAKNLRRFKTSKWTADFINEHENSNNLVIEIHHDNKKLINIINGKEDIECIFFAHDTDLAIPFDWFFDLVVVAQKITLPTNKILTC